MRQEIAQLFGVVTWQKVFVSPSCGLLPVLDFFETRDAGQYEKSLKAATGTEKNVGVCTIADH